MEEACGVAWLNGRVCVSGWKRRMGVGVVVRGDGGWGFVIALKGIRYT